MTNLLPRAVHRERRVKALLRAMKDNFVHGKCTHIDLVYELEDLFEETKRDPDKRHTS